MNIADTKTQAITAALQTYADALDIAVKEIPLDQQIALMSACVVAVKTTLDEIDRELAR